MSRVKNGYSPEESRRRCRVVMGYLDMIEYGSGRSASEMEEEVIDAGDFFVASEGMKELTRSDPWAAEFSRVMFENVAFTRGEDGVYYVDVASVGRNISPLTSLLRRRTSSRGLR